MEEWWMIIRYVILWIAITCMSILLSLYLVFKPLRTHPGELLMISTVFAGYWVFYIYTDYGALYVDQTDQDIIDFVNQFFFFGKS